MLSKYILLFTLCSVVGWVYESIYAICKTKAWDERGFLYGPLCPIYGFGVCGIVLAAKAVLMYTGADYVWWHITLAAFFGSMSLEYITSWVLEQLFHAYWWDYSDMPLNIGGRTCIPAGILFALGGLGAVYIISPWWDSITAGIPPLAMDIAALIVVVLITIDSTLTISSLTAIQEQVAFAARMFHTKADAVTTNLLDKGADVIDKGADVMGTAASRIAAEKDRIQEEVLQNTFDNLSESARLALRRVEGFRPAAPNVSLPSASDFPAFAKGLLERAKGRKSK